MENIIPQVRQRGDYALKKVTLMIDGVFLEHIEVDRGKWAAAWEDLELGVRDALVFAHDRIRAFHERQLAAAAAEAGPIGRRWVPLDRVGVYVPGGRASYPSSALMALIPAKVAGVREVIVCSPPGKDGVPNHMVLAVAHFVGADRVFAVGGAQAIAAMAFGTDTIPKVQRIVGPGNIYVAAAKRMLRTEVESDFYAGPSELLVLADATADPAYVASDLLAQAEHDPEATCVLVTPDPGVADAVAAEIDRQIDGLPTEKTAAKSLEKHGAIVVVPSLDAGIEVANEFAPEHLSIVVADPEPVVLRITAAGAVFVGAFAPVAAGDYAAGPNHILPTGGAARIYSGLGIDQFLRKMSVQRIDREELRVLAPAVTTLARLEGLEAHARSVELRLRDRPGGGAP